MSTRMKGNGITCHAGHQEHELPDSEIFVSLPLHCVTAQIYTLSTQSVH